MSNAIKPSSRTRFLTGGKNILLVFAGTLILAFGVAVFILPYRLVVGGVSGFSVLLERILSFPALTADRVIAILSWLFFFLGLIALGWRFAVKTLLSTALYPLFIAVFMLLVDPTVFGGIFYLQGSALSELALMLAATVGGAIIGLGCALTFLGGGSTGGIDVLAFIVCKAFPRLRHAYVLFVIDSLIVLGGLLIFRDLPLSLLGILSSLFTAIVIDRLLSRREAAATSHS